MGFGRSKKKPAKDARAADRARAKRAALRALRKTRRAAETAGTLLSAWEDDFLGSVEGRVEKFGRAFRDREKGEPGASLSALQSRKLKEIGAKARRKAKPAHVPPRAST